MTNTSGHTQTGADCCTTPDLQSEAAGRCCTTSDAKSEAVAEIKTHEVAPEVAALRAAGFHLLLHGKKPVEQFEWAEAASINPDNLDEVLTKHAGRIELDEHGRLIGIAGLTIRATTHELDINGEQFWTWCALDAVGILGALEATGTIRSIDPSSKDPVTLTFDNGQVQNDATLFVLSGYDGADIRGEWCPLVNFFNNRTDAESWVKDNRLLGDLITVQEVAPQAADLWRTATHPTT